MKLPPILTGIVLDPVAGTLDFSALGVGFDPRTVLGVLHEPSNRFVFAKGRQGLGYRAIVGSVMMLAADVSDLAAGSLTGFVDDGALIATDARLEACRALLATGNATLSNLATGLGTPSDVATGSDTAPGSLIAKLTRLLATQTGIAGLLGAIRDRLDQSIALLDGSTATNDTSGTAIGGTSTVALAANAARQFVEITNTGANPMAYRWGAAASASGHILGSGQSVRYEVRVPTGSLNVFSTNGTSYFVTFG